jgi:hypothetical protein
VAWTMREMIGMASAWRARGPEPSHCSKGEPQRLLDADGHAEPAGQPRRDLARVLHPLRHEYLAVDREAHGMRDARAQSISSSV